MSLKIYLLRHGETEYSQRSAYCGSLDAELTAEGHQMAQAFAEGYRSIPWADVYVSPMKRAIATAQPLCDAVGLPMQIRDGLREIAYGAWEDQELDYVRQHYEQDYLRWQTDPAWNPPTGGETAIQIAARALPVITEIESRHKDGNVLLVGDIFYHRDVQHFRDYTGCGNTINCNHPLITHFLVYCLEYWVKTMRVDGFRFDLASVFARGDDGSVLNNPSLPWSIELSHALAQTPIIAEAWNATGLYQVGSFPGTRWSEWNGRSRYIIRRFIRGDRGLIGEVATCLTGSSDLYADKQRLPTSSINFITCHDGFTLWDLVSYNNKYNLANGENNRDGTDQNLSWNCGKEGETSDLKVLDLRRRQACNFMAMLFLSQGVPMFLAGDEFLHTQGGNNNAWCQNNELSWLDWRLPETNREMVRFVRELIAFRQRHPCLTRSRFLTGQPASSRGIPDVAWHDLHLNAPLWGDNEAQVLAFTLAGTKEIEEDLHIVLNMSEQDIKVQLPDIPLGSWHLAIDTAAPSPGDIIERVRQRAADGDILPVQARSVVVFEAREINK